MERIADRYAEWTRVFREASGGSRARGATQAWSSAGRLSHVTRRRGVEIELVLAWGDHVMCVAYVAPGGRFILGEGGVCDALVPAEAIGSSRMEIVAFHPTPRVLPPRSARVRLHGEPTVTGPTELTGNDVVEVFFGAFTLRTRLVEHEALPRGGWNLRGAWWGALSVAAHLAMLGAVFALARPDAKEDLTPERLAILRRLLAASDAARVEPLVEKPSRRRADDRPNHSADTERPPIRPQSSLVPEGPEEARPSVSVASSNPKASRATELEEAEGFGMIALARGMRADGPPAPSWSEALAATGAHAEAVKSMFGDPRMEDWGVGGLALSGVGEGGGGKMGDGHEVKTEIASLTAMLDRERATFVPGAIVKVPDTHARLGPGLPLDQVPAPPLPQDAATRLVRANVGRFLACRGLVQRQEPNAHGEVDVAFTVEPDGRVSEAHEAGGDFPDPGVRQCVARVFFGLTFPVEPRRRPQKMHFPIVLGSSEK